MRELRKYVLLSALGCLLALAQQSRPSKSQGAVRSGAPPAHQQEAVASFTGTFRRLEHHRLLVEDENSNTMVYYLVKKTRILDGDSEMKPTALKPGDRVQIEAEPHGEGSLDAVTVRLQKGDRKPAS